MSTQHPGAGAVKRGEVARRENRQSDAEKEFTEAIDFFRGHGPRGDLAHALTRRAQIERDLGRYEDALRDQQEALAIYRAIDDEVRLPHTIRHLADILQDMGMHNEAHPYYVEMQILYQARQSASPLEIANAMRSAALHAEYMGDLKESQRLWLQVRAQYAALDDVFLELTGNPTNPGVSESEKRLGALAARIAATDGRSN